jgi:hypothetical protein
MQPTGFLAPFSLCDTSLRESRAACRNGMASLYEKNKEAGGQYMKFIKATIGCFQRFKHIVHRVFAAQHSLPWGIQPNSAPCKGTRLKRAGYSKAYLSPLKFRLYMLKGVGTP